MRKLNVSGGGAESDRLARAIDVKIDENPLNEIGGRDVWRSLRFEEAIDFFKWRIAVGLACAGGRRVRLTVVSDEIGLHCKKNNLFYFCARLQTPQAARAL